MSIEVLKRVAALPGISTADLKGMWKELCLSEPPPYNRAFLVKRLAYRIQELAHSGLAEKTEKRLERLASGKDAPTERKRHPGERLLPGTRLVREWKGVEHCCTVLENGFEYQGRRFGSLSAVANFITGTRWNGLVFFGLKKQGDEQ
ncbi:MAG: DUF2924 domain-containing protein [Nitrospirae bacterium]|nr:DUF2924 domain-containing protein [Magnetococcales bacterium]